MGENIKSFIESKGTFENLKSRGGKINEGGERWIPLSVSVCYEPTSVVSAGNPLWWDDETEDILCRKDEKSAFSIILDKTQELLGKSIGGSSLKDGELIPEDAIELPLVECITGQRVWYNSDFVYFESIDTENPYSLTHKIPMTERLSKTVNEYKQDMENYINQCKEDKEILSEYLDYQIGFDDYQTEIARECIKEIIKTNGDLHVVNDKNTPALIGETPHYLWKNSNDDDIIYDAVYYDNEGLYLFGECGNWTEDLRPITDEFGSAYYAHPWTESLKIHADRCVNYMSRRFMFKKWREDLNNIEDMYPVVFNPNHKCRKPFSEAIEKTTKKSNVFMNDREKLITALLQRKFSLNEHDGEAAAFIDIVDKMDSSYNLINELKKWDLEEWEDYIDWIKESKEDNPEKFNNQYQTTMKFKSWLDNLSEDKIHWLMEYYPKVAYFFKVDCGNYHVVTYGSNIQRRCYDDEIGCNIVSNSWPNYRNEW